MASGHSSPTTQQRKGVIPPRHTGSKASNPTLLNAVYSANQQYSNPKSGHSDSLKPLPRRRTHFKAFLARTGIDADFATIRLNHWLSIPATTKGRNRLFSQHNNYKKDPLKLQVRAARLDEDWAGIWRVIEPVVRAGETFALDRAMDEDEARAHWFSPDKTVFVAEADGEILGTYYLRANHPGGGNHVANCGYMVSSTATGRGVARAMGQHSLDHARSCGFRAVQFNFVVSTNERAVRLWQFLGFSIVARLPGAFHHPVHGYVDALVMYQEL